MNPLTADQIAQRLGTLVDGWEYAGGRISKTYAFQDYYQTMAFVNATAWVSHRQDHHPDIELGYNRCKVSYQSHDIGGISERDFICAAKIDALFGI